MNGADMDPFEGQPLYRDYEPSPQVVPDTRIGFDEFGNFHAVEHFTVEGLANAITPYRWASYLQDALEQYIRTSDYTVGLAERDDIVQDIVAERMESLDDQREINQLQEALEMWRRTYR